MNVPQIIYVEQPAEDCMYYVFTFDGVIVHTLDPQPRMPHATSKQRKARTAAAQAVFRTVGTRLVFAEAVPGMDTAKIGVATISDARWFGTWNPAYLTPGDLEWARPHERVLDACIQAAIRHHNGGAPLPE